MIFPASSAAIRNILSSNPNLKSVLRQVEELRGSDREEALEQLLGVSVRKHGLISLKASEDDIKAMKEFSEALEKCIRGNEEDARGLDWL